METTKLSSTMHLGDDNEPARELPAEYKHGGNVFKMVKRGSKAVMYHTEESDCPGHNIYEVFMIKVRPAGVIKGVAIPKREVVPGNCDFGAWAWCYSGRGEFTLNKANEKFDSIEAGHTVETKNEMDN